MQVFESCIKVQLGLPKLQQHIVPWVTLPSSITVHKKHYFTFMLPCIVIDFFLNDQPDALIIQIYSVIKLYMFRAFSLSIIRSFFYCIFGSGKFHAGF